MAIGVGMKKNIIILSLILLVNFIFAEPIDIFNLDPWKSSSEFENLSMEDQYNSVILSFKEKTKGRPLPYESKWAYTLVKRFGRELLPLINNTLKTEELDHIDRNPVNRSLINIGYFFHHLQEQKLLTDQELELYGIIVSEKIDRYIMKYRVIDSSVSSGHFILECLKFPMPIWGNIENVAKIRDSYETKLGITGIRIGKDIFDDVVESPLAEYITD